MTTADDQARERARQAGLLPGGPIEPGAPSGWAQDQEWERAWWGDCTNTFSEENKQISYAHRMGLEMVATQDGRWPVYNLGGRRVLDIGGGPVSLLLKCVNRGPCLVADPCHYPQWVMRRYQEAGIQLIGAPGEQLEPGAIGQGQFDEVWIYNVLQHVQDPQRIAANARQLAPVVRVFEWIDTPSAPGHPHTLTAQALATWFQTPGQVEQMDENGCVGPAWYGVAHTAEPLPSGPLPLTLTDQIAAIVASVNARQDYEGGATIDEDEAREAAEQIVDLLGR